MTIRELLQEAEELKAKYGEDASIHYAIVDKEMVKEVVEDNDLMLEVTDDFMTKFVEFIERSEGWDIFTEDGLYDALEHCNYNTSCGVDFYD